MQTKIELQMTRMPNFIKATMPGAGEYMVPVQSLTEKEAKRFAREMQKAFMAHWEHRQKNPIEPKQQSFSQEEGVWNK